MPTTQATPEPVMAGRTMTEGLNPLLRWLKSQFLAQPTHASVPIAPSRRQLFDLILTRTRDAQSPVEFDDLIWDLAESDALWTALAEHKHTGARLEIRRSWPPLSDDVGAELLKLLSAFEPIAKAAAAAAPLTAAQQAEEMGRLRQLLRNPLAPRSLARGVWGVARLDVALSAAALWAERPDLNWPSWYLMTALNTARDGLRDVVRLTAAIFPGAVSDAVLPAVERPNLLAEATVSGALGMAFIAVRQADGQAPVQLINLAE